VPPTFEMVPPPMPLASQYTEKMQEFWLKIKQVLFDIVMKIHFENMMFHNTEKTETCHRNVLQVLFVARTTINGKVIASFIFLFHKLAVNVSLVD